MRWLQDRSIFSKYKYQNIRGIIEFTEGVYELLLSES
jgi:hypothetical protein